MTTKRKPQAVFTRDTLPLTFRGLDLCDSCGARLEPEDQLWGLCPASAFPPAESRIMRRRQERQ